MNFVVAVHLMVALGCTSGGELDSHLIRSVSDFRLRNGEEDVFNIMCSLLDGEFTSSLFPVTFCVRILLTI